MRKCERFWTLPFLFVDLGSESERLVHLFDTIVAGHEGFEHRRDEFSHLCGLAVSLPIGLPQAAILTVLHDAEQFGKFAPGFKKQLLSTVSTQMGAPQKPCLTAQSALKKFKRL